MVHYFEDRREWGLFTMISSLHDHLRSDLEKFGSIQFLDAAFHGHPNIVLKKAYSRTCKRRTTRMGGKASA